MLEVQLLMAIPVFSVYLGLLVRHLLFCLPSSLFLKRKKNSQFQRLPACCGIMQLAPGNVIQTFVTISPHMKAVRKRGAKRMAGTKRRWRASEKPGRRGGSQPLSSAFTAYCLQIAAQLPQRSQDPPFMN